MFHGLFERFVSEWVLAVVPLESEFPHVQRVHTSVIPLELVKSNRTVRHTPSDFVQMVCASETTLVRGCACTSHRFEGRTSLIGSQTGGISVLHNRVGRHREDGP